MNKIMYGDILNNKYLTSIIDITVFKIKGDS